jgi:AAA15 family ATPase/GTPase
MLKSLVVKNFRMLEDFSIPKLGRVNLIVGKNNSGKSSVLEAIRIFAGSAEAGLLENIALGHDERVRSREVDFYSEDTPLPFESFFSSRIFPDEDGKAIEIGDPLAHEMLSIEHGYFLEQEESRTDESGTSTFTRRKRLSKSAVTEGQDYSGQALYVSKGSRSFSVRMDTLRDPLNEMPRHLPCSVIPTRFVSIDELADEWDKIALTDNQDIVKDALKFISPDFQDITFVRRDDRGTTARRQPQLSRTAMVRLAGSPRPVPLNSLGDGMLRVLQLILKVFPAKGGALLIDEFENGLHYSIQEKIWGLLFELAVKLDIQIFATTHSWDCIESFAKVAKERTEVEGTLVRVGRSARTSDKGKVIATVFDEDQLLSLTQADVEVR